MNYGVENFILKTAITATVKFFAAYQVADGVNELVLKFPHGTPVKAVCDRFSSQLPCSQSPVAQVTR
ncbi:hypothetical protein [Cylindrospermum sp. FACHB-282]|uniref:hypothetical protein n=1 Tax=Cylindrospermum sp. FACHB-282 TaxID=2692794 RepID=UPI0018F00429|nr:hypothetical protein [Cylindrospermum sp. FACHB-282]